MLHKMEKTLDDYQSSKHSRQDTTDSFFQKSMEEKNNTVNDKMFEKIDNELKAPKIKLDANEERHQLEVWMRNITLMNDNDDKADVRDCIAETKGVKHRLNTGYGAVLKMVPRE